MKNNNNHNSSMMWWMVAGCLLLPIAFIAISSGLGGFAIGSNWPWLIFVLLFIGVHVGMLFHGGHGNESHKHGQNNKK